MCRVDFPSQDPSSTTFFGRVFLINRSIACALPYHPCGSKGKILSREEYSSGRAPTCGMLHFVSDNFHAVELVTRGFLNPYLRRPWMQWSSKSNLEKGMFCLKMVDNFLHPTSGNQH